MPKIKTNACDCFLTGQSSGILPGVILGTPYSDEFSRDVQIMYKYRGLYPKPCYLTRKFCEAMERSTGAFKDVIGEVLETNNEKIGILRIPNLPQVTLIYMVQYPVLLIHICFSEERDFTLGIRILATWQSDRQVFSVTTKDSLSRPDSGQNSVLELVLGYLCMKKYAKVEISEIKPGKKVRLDGVKYKNESTLDYNIFDSSWFTKVCNDNDFSVRGHFRLQPYKDEQGEWQKKLIFINGFIKHGYHRQAKIERT